MSLYTTIINPIVTVAMLLLMLSLETLRPKRAWEASRAKRLLFHVGLAILNGLIIGLVTLTPFLFWRDLVHAWGWGIASLLGLTGMPEIFAGIVVLDMLDYWWHRFNHRIPFLWRFHKVHHVDTHVDVTTALRFHPGELLISSGLVKVLWLFIWGPSILAFVAFEAAVTAASEFHHSNIDFSDFTEGLLRKIIVTPRYHAAHHTVARRTGDNNLATIFIFWDKLFGTYREPDWEEMKLLGLPGGRRTYLSLKSTLTGPLTSEY